MEVHLLECFNIFKNTVRTSAWVDISSIKICHSGAAHFYTTDIILKQIKSGQVIILWACEHPQPGDGRWPEAPEGKSFTILTDHELKMTNRLYPYHEIKYDAVLSLDNDVTLHQEEIDFSFTVWQTFPHRIVGFPARVSFSLQRKRRNLDTLPSKTLS